MSQIDELNDAQLMRYSRQIMLPEIDYAGQLAIANARVLIIGLGGLGSPVSLYLASAGVGHLTLVDFDQVDTSNLQRQVIHTQARVGMNKAESAKLALNAINPECAITVLTHALEGDALTQAFNTHDLVIDCSDNFTTRFALNRASQATSTPLISGAAIRLEGQVSVYDPRQADAPCYACLYKEEGDMDINCTTNGVLAPLVGLVGSIQATEALKLLAGHTSPLTGKLLLIDAMTMQFRSLKLPKDAACNVCGKGH